MTGAAMFTIKDVEKLIARATSLTLADWGEAKQSLPDI